MQYVASHLKVVSGDTERPDHGILRESERRQSGDMLHVDVLICGGFWLSYRAAYRIASGSHQSRQASPVRLQIDVLYDVLSCAGDHNRVLVMMILSSTLLTALRRSWCRQGRRYGWYVVARNCLVTRRRASRASATRLLRQRRRLRLWRARVVSMGATSVSPYRCWWCGRYRRHHRWWRRRTMQHIVSRLRVHCETINIPSEL